MWPTGVLLLTLFCSSSQSRSASEWTAAGWEALRAGRATEAADDFHNALRLDGHDALAMLGAGVSAHLRGKPADAREQLASALAIEPA